MNVSREDKTLLRLAVGFAVSFIVLVSFAYTVGKYDFPPNLMVVVPGDWMIALYVAVLLALYTAILMAPYFLAWFFMASGRWLYGVFAAWCVVVVVVMARFVPFAVQFTAKV